MKRKSLDEADINQCVMPDFPLCFRDDDFDAVMEITVFLASAIIAVAAIDFGIKFQKPYQKRLDFFVLRVVRLSPI